MKLRHYSDRHVTGVTSPEKPQTICSKPQGFWLSDDGDNECNWRAWCESEGFRLGSLTHTHAVRLRDAAKVLSIHSVEELDSFHGSFRFQPEWSRGLSYPRYEINWPDVAECWDGIIITPYQWARRLDGEASNSYYGWDCASGCIWNPTAIASLELIEVRDALEVRGDPFKPLYPKMLAHGQYDWNM